MRQRTFLVAAAFARLAAREHGVVRLTEGYFPAAPEHGLVVEIASDTAALVMTQAGDGRVERTEIPRGHAEALMAVAAGRIERLDTSLTLDRHPLRLSRIVAPGLLDLITITFANDAEASTFTPPAWFGPEVSAEPNYDIRSLALAGIPATLEIAVSNAGLDSLLDALESRAARETGAALTAPVTPRPAPPPSEPESVTEEAEAAAIEDDVIRELARSLRPQRR